MSASALAEGEEYPSSDTDDFSDTNAYSDPAYQDAAPASTCGIDAVSPTQKSKEFSRYQLDRKRWYGSVLVVYTNSTQCAQKFHLATVSFLDARGNVLGSDDEVVGTVQPGQVTAVAETLLLDGKPASVEIDLQEVNAADPIGGAVKASHIRLTGGLTDRHVVGRLDSEYAASDVSRFNVVVVYRAKNGDFLGADNDASGGIRATQGGVNPFDIEITLPMPSPRIETFVTPS